MIRQMPSLANVGLLDMGMTVEALVNAGVTGFHIDIMDGHYVPNLCFPPTLCREISEKYPDIDMDVHLMVDNPFDYIEPMKAYGVKYLSIHMDSTRFAYRCLKTIQSQGMKAGIVINPSQKVDVIEPVLAVTDYVLYMTVEPGISGQSSLPETVARIKDLIALRERTNSRFQVFVDAGVTFELLKEYIELGVDVAVTGKYTLFGQADGIAGACRRFDEFVRSCSGAH